ncbi:glucose 1-dehydrogenase [candidate division KSB1 bacterium]|nr:glucose 1-dehydrogenase [candidate division KSB1 bacterium]
MNDLKTLFNLTNKVALVTGGSRGLGKEMAEGLAEAGAALMLVARREAWLKPTIAEMQSRGFRCEGMLADVSKPNDVQRVVTQTLSTYGQIDILINNAGVSWGAPAENMPLDKWQMVIDINLTGPFLLCQAVGREMIKRQFGRIINIASIAGLLATPPNVQETVGYNAAKGGLLSLTRELAVKWAKHNIRVNAIAPGFFSSRLADKVIEQSRATLEAITPMGRIGAPGELKGVAVFLAAEASNYLTGQTIAVDGGASIV